MKSYNAVCALNLLTFTTRDTNLMCRSVCLFNFNIRKKRTQKKTAIYYYILSISPFREYRIKFIQLQAMHPNYAGNRSTTMQPPAMSNQPDSSIPHHYIRLLTMQITMSHKFSLTRGRFLATTNCTRYIPSNGRPEMNNAGSWSIVCHHTQAHLVPLESTQSTNT